jgi:hypothetical protein
MKHAIVFRSSGDLDMVAQKQANGPEVLMGLTFILHWLLNSAGQLATCRQRMLTGTGYQPKKPCGE